MRTIVHLSDLHFGRIDAPLLAPLRSRIEAVRPHLVVVSGDLTQRAKTRQFREARAFLDTLPRPQLVVPGNHDVPLYNVAMRFFAPLARYRRYFGEDVEPVYADDELVAVGINTARSLTFKGGRINQEQIGRVRARLCDLSESVTKIVVTHHPFDVPEGEDDDHIVGRARIAVDALAECGADLLLSGHLHATHAQDTTKRYKTDAHAALVVQAGTATSTRGRGEANSFNVLQASPGAVRVDQYSWNAAGAEFSLAKTESFERRDKGWHRTPETPRT